MRIRRATLHRELTGALAKVSEGSRLTWQQRSGLIVRMRPVFVSMGLATLAVLQTTCGRTLVDAGAPGAAGSGGVAGQSTGAAGVADAGAAGTGGASESGGAEPGSGVNAVRRGAGCGIALPSETQPTVIGSAKGYTQFSVMSTGANLTSTPLPAKAGPRTFWVRVPADYDPQRAYRVVFVGQGCGDPGTANTVALPLYSEGMGGTEQAIYVAIDLPPIELDKNCYDTAGLQSEEWEAFELYMSFVDQHYCADLNKVYVAGYSTGAWLANMWGCYFSADPTPPRKFAPGYHIRAQVALYGQEPAEQPPCGGPVAGLWMHGTVSSNVSPLSEVAAPLARVGRTNGCNTTYDDASAQTPWHNDDPVLARGICARFAGCPADYPVVLCEPPVPVQVGPDSNFSIPAITKFFAELEAGR